MKPHYSEADLLETYYTRPGQSLPVMMHLADCSECAARYERLETKMQSLRSCHHQEKTETFWARQRLSILRKIDARSARRASISRVTRVAAAAMLVLVLGGIVTWNQIETPAAPQPAVETAQTAAADETSAVDTAADPWASEELNDYSSMVAWESWVENGDQS